DSSASPTSATASVSAATVTSASSMSFINSVEVASSQQSIVLEQGESDQISGFNPTSNKLDLTQVLAQSQISLSELSQVGSYFGLTDSGDNATLSFYSHGVSAGGGSALATLIGVGPNVTLSTLIDHGALKIA